MGGFVRKYIQRRPKQIGQQIKQAQSGPTKAEMDALRMARIKRKGRKSTKLGMEDDDLFLSIKTLLG
tara:strand:- start:346 stop:546 length:201 start_codon:yes stop_codon:yes gene_type:complete